MPPPGRAGPAFSIGTMMAAIALIAANLAVGLAIPALLFISLPLSIAAIRTLIAFRDREPLVNSFESLSKVFFSTYFAALLSELAGTIAFAVSCTAVAFSGEVTKSGPSRLVPALVVGSCFGVPLACWLFLAILRAYRREDAARQALRSKREA